MPEPVEIHVGDIGTRYRVRVQDDDGDFDPSTASIKQLIFALPNGVVIEKDATVATGSGDEAGQFFLVYEVDAGEGSPPDEFHEIAGPMTVQAYLEWSDGDRYHSNKITTDQDGNELRIHTNLN